MGTDGHAGLRGAGVRLVAEEVLLSPTFSCLESNIPIVFGITFSVLDPGGARRSPCSAPEGCRVPDEYFILKYAAGEQAGGWGLHCSAQCVSFYRPVSCRRTFSATETCLRATGRWGYHRRGRRLDCET